MSKKEETVDFVARDGVTLYPGRSIAGHPAGTTVRLPKSHADAIAHLRASQPEPAETDAHAHAGPAEHDAPSEQD